jgi:hypothetical protein
MSTILLPAVAVLSPPGFAFLVIGVIAIAAAALRGWTLVQREQARRRREHFEMEHQARRQEMEREHQAHMREMDLTERTVLLDEDHYARKGDTVREPLGGDPRKRIATASKAGAGRFRPLATGRPMDECRFSVQAPENRGLFTARVAP